MENFYKKPKLKNPMQKAIMDRMEGVAKYQPATGNRPMLTGEPKPGTTVPDFESAPSTAPESLINNPEFLKFQQALFAMMNKGKK